MGNDDLTPTQDASQRMADAVFADPTLRARFELMAKETANREPVPDDFAWLSPVAEPDAYSKYEDLAPKLVAVPKSVIDNERAAGR